IYVLWRWCETTSSKRGFAPHLIRMGHCRRPNRKPDVHGRVWPCGVEVWRWTLGMDSHPFLDSAIYHRAATGPVFQRDVRRCPALEIDAKTRQDTILDRAVGTAGRRNLRGAAPQLGSGARQADVSCRFYFGPVSVYTITRVLSISG